MLIFIQVNMPFWCKTICLSVWRCPSSIELEDAHIHIDKHSVLHKKTVSDIFVLVYRVDHGQNINILSKSGTGTRYFIYVPVAHHKNIYPSRILIKAVWVAFCCRYRYWISKTLHICRQLQRRAFCLPAWTLWWTWPTSAAQLQQQTPPQSQQTTAQSRPLSRPSSSSRVWLWRRRTSRSIWRGWGEWCYLKKTFTLWVRII